MIDKEKLTGQQSTENKSCIDVESYFKKHIGQ